MDERHEAGAARVDLWRCASRQVLTFVAASTTIGVLIAAMALPVVWIGAGLVRDVTTAADLVPADMDVGALPQRSTILDANGDVLAHVYAENRVSVPLGDVSRTFVKALLAVEDSASTSMAASISGAHSGPWSRTSGPDRWCRADRASPSSW